MVTVRHKQQTPLAIKSLDWHRIAFSGTEVSRLNEISVQAALRALHSMPIQGLCTCGGGDGLPNFQT